MIRALGRTGLSVSPLGFGGIPIQRVSADEACRTVEAALAAGITLFDSARRYTDSEAKLGRALRAVSGVSIATKSMALTRQAMAADIEKSLQALGVGRIALYQLHNVKDDASLDRVLAPGGALEALVAAREQGRISFIGITGHVPHVLVRALQAFPFDTVQFPLNPVETGALDELLPLARALGVGTLAMKPLGGGALRPASALRWALARGVDVALAGMATVDEVRANAAAIAAAPEAGEAAALRAEAAALGERFCRRCEYCKPCPEGIDVPLLWLLDGYATRYGLAGWARDLYARQERNASHCSACGACEERCPYDLPIREMLRGARGRLEV